MIDKFDGPYRFLSNFWGCSVSIGMMTFASAEHAYQAAKSLDLQEWKLIQRCPTPGAAKRAGHALKIRPDWDQVKNEVMEIIVKTKFHQHSNLAHLLVETGDQELIEGNTWGDTYWGVCNGIGENHLGKILMKIRSEL